MSRPVHKLLNGNYKSTTDSKVHVQNKHHNSLLDTETNNSFIRHGRRMLHFVRNAIFMLTAISPTSIPALLPFL